VGVDHVSAATVRCEAVGELRVKELDERGNALSGRELSDVCRWLDAKHRYATRLVELQQVAVVASDLDHETRGPETAHPNERFDQKTRMLDHGVREGRRIGVVAKQPLARHGLTDLHQRALRAEKKLQRKPVAWLPCICRKRVLVGGGLVVAAYYCRSTRSSFFADIYTMYEQGQFA
jgi:hypothetical protein